ncbi:MAG TPA: nucleotide sugar dehydrogenase [Candidatus Hydrogenedentes bacterium]|nr:nucleotide sugar dehydrogenase [Candidatus Hydrogenedentota bacterium]
MGNDTTSEICVLGMGYIGLPTAAMFAANGFRVHGVDTNPEVVATIGRGDIHIEEPGLKTLVRGAVSSGMLRVGEEPVPASLFIIAVPTPLTSDKKADMRAVDAATRALLPVLRPGNTVVLESTSPPGTCRNRIRPVLEAAGWKVGETVFLAHCPERVLPGRILAELITNDRVIGGMTPACARSAARWYARLVDGEIFLTDATTAELVKLAENTYRDVNIALANELASVCEVAGANFWEVQRLANRHPRVNIHRAGPGVGGHCISVDPWFLVEMFPDRTPLIRAAREVNDAVPARVVAGVPGAAETVTLLGLAFKGNVDDCRESPAIAIASLLEATGRVVRVYDPLVHRPPIPIAASLEESVRDSDLIILTTPHDVFHDIDPARVAPLTRRRALIDTHDFLDHERWRAAGFDVMLRGTPSFPAYRDQR